MTLAELNDVCSRNNIPDSVKLMSDSGWECDATDLSIDGIYYHEGSNTIVITQGSEHDFYRKNFDYLQLH